MCVPATVFPQSFNKNDVLYWIQNEPAFGRQAVYLDDANTVADLPGFAELVGYQTEGINISGRRMFALLALDGRQSHRRRRSTRRTRRTPASTSSPGHWSARAFWLTGTTTSTTRPSTRPSRATVT